jgi:hypothetical protein
MALMKPEGPKRQGHREISSRISMIPEKQSFQSKV